MASEPVDVDVSSAEEEEHETKSRGGTSGSGSARKPQQRRLGRKLHALEPAVKLEPVGRLPVSDITVKLETIPFVRDIHSLTRDFPHLCTDTKTPARCIGSAAGGSGSGSGSELVQVKVEKEEEAKTMVKEEEKDEVSPAVMSSLEYKQLQARVDAIGRVKLAEEMAAPATIMGQTALVEDLRDGRKALFKSTAEHESFLLRASGKWQINDQGPIIDFPPCIYGQHNTCILQIPRMKHPSVGISYLYPAELKRVLEGLPFPSKALRPCVACIRWRVQDGVYLYRSLLGHVNIKRVIKESKQVLADLEKDEHGWLLVPTEKDEEDARKRQQLPPPRSAVFQMSRDEIMQMYYNSSDTEGGYVDACLIKANEMNWDGLVGDMVAWNLQWITETKSKFGQPIYDQSMIRLKPIGVAELEPGLSQANF